MTDVDKAYIYYRTLPLPEPFLFRQKYVPENYRDYFPHGEHMGFEDFASLYETSEEFKDLIDKQQFRKLVEDYVIRNARFVVSPRFPHRYGSGTYGLDLQWKDDWRTFYYKSSYISVD